MARGVWSFHWCLRHSTVTFYAFCSSSALALHLSVKAWLKWLKCPWNITSLNFEILSLASESWKGHNHTCFDFSFWTLSTSKKRETWFELHFAYYQISMYFLYYSHVWREVNKIFVFFKIFLGVWLKKSLIWAGVLYTMYNYWEELTLYTCSHGRVSKLEGEGQNELLYMTGETVNPTSLKDCNLHLFAGIFHIHQQIMHQKKRCENLLLLFF